MVKTAQSLQPVTMGVAPLHDPATNRTARAPLFGVRPRELLILWAFGSLAMWSADQAFASVVPGDLRLTWRTLVGAMLAAWLILIMLLRFGTSRLHVSARRVIPPFVTIGMWLAVLSVLWLFLPYGGTALRFATLLFTAIYLVTVLVSTPDQPRLATMVILTTTASMALVTVIFRVELWPYLAPFMLVFGFALNELARTLRQSVAGMMNAKQQAERDRDARARFMAAASHDLGQPLRAARLLLRQSVQHHDPAARARAADTAAEALAAMQRLVESMLEHLRLQSSATVPRWRPVPLSESIGRVASRYEAAAQLQGIDLRAVPSKTVLTTDGDLLERALGNLVDNALRHARCGRVLIGARCRGPVVRLLVLDDGNGVPTADRPGLFDEFKQGQNAGAGERGGFGLGLASVAQIATLLHGRCGLDERWRSGSAFFIELPLGAGQSRA